MNVAFWLFQCVALHNTILSDRLFQASKARDKLIMARILTANHPGPIIKARIITKEMSITKAATLMGVGRVALTNFLNGKATLSTEMVTRLEATFGYQRQELMQMQAAYEAGLAELKETPPESLLAVPPFLALKANHIEAWVTKNIVARSRFAVFLRTLVNSTGRGIIKCDFPGNDDAERQGVDGIVEAEAGTPWIPKGVSHWEFGTNVDLQTKAKKDFEKSIKACSPETRADITFVVVTPHRWLDKKKWLADRQGQWKDVRVYDASDLEQWLEQSISGQVWLANETKSPAQDVRSLDFCWTSWAGTPPIAESFFHSAAERYKKGMLDYLSKPPTAPFLVTADSAGEALAFLAQLFRDETLLPFRDRVLVFDKPGVIQRLVIDTPTFIPVVARRDVEPDLDALSRSTHCILIYPRNAIDRINIELEPPTYDAFAKGLEAMGKSRDEINALANETGRSLTVLQRRLSNLPAVRTPAWANDHTTAESLIPFLLVGVWDSQNEYDRDGLSDLSQQPYETLDKQCLRFTEIEDAPLWWIASLRGVVSKYDLFFAIRKKLTRVDLERFFALAELVLGEDDPKLDLPSEGRYLALIRAKKRLYSKAFRDGVAETVVLLAVYGRESFQSRLGIDTESWAERLVTKCLGNPLTTRSLEANDRDLPLYAEAAPKAFLSILENDLRSPDPAVFGLLKPAGSVFGSSTSRTGLLWALEGLAWNPDTFLRSCLILARLSQIEIVDNWANKPMGSLQSIFRSWMPQTAADHDQRLMAMQRLERDFPDIAWPLCISQFNSLHRTGHYSNKPRWRRDGNGFGEPFSTWEPILRFNQEMVEMSLGWRHGHSLEKLSDLTTSLQYLQENQQARVWQLIKDWARSDPDDKDKAALREVIRRHALSTQAARRVGRPPHLIRAAEEAYAALEPRDLLNKHAWLFRSGWIDESYDDVHGDQELDWQAAQGRIAQLRADALKEIIAELGYSGVAALAEQGDAAAQIGWLMAQKVLPEAANLSEFLRFMLSDASTSSRKEQIVRTCLGVVPVEECTIILGNLAGNGAEDIWKLYALAPFRRSTWGLVDKLGEQEQSAYWSGAAADCTYDSDQEYHEAAIQLLRVERPKAAFYCLHLYPEKIDPRLLLQVLTEMTQGGKDVPNSYLPSPYNIEQAIKRIASSPDISLEQKAVLEFLYIDVLSRSSGTRDDNVIPNLEYYIETHPEVFVTAIVWAYRRQDGSVDPPQWLVAQDKRSQAAERGYKLLKSIERIPGHNDMGQLETARLIAWVEIVRESCVDLSRSAVGDMCIGTLLASSPVGTNGVWPCEEVCDAIEHFHSADMISGARMGRYNSRGAHWVGDNGAVERGIADQYREWASALRFTHPFVAEELLTGMARMYKNEATGVDDHGRLRQRGRW